MKTTKFWVILFSVIIFAAGAASVVIHNSKSGALIANIYQDGECIYSIDLSEIEEGYMLRISGEVTNIISVDEHGICVLEATCPDQICVRQGRISDSAEPIVCLPNSLVIRIEGGSDSKPDGTAR